MRFAATHKLVSYLLVVATFVTLLTAEAISALQLAGLLAVAAASWPFDTGSRAARITDRLAPLTHLLVVAFSLLSVWDARGRMVEGDPRPILNMVLGLIGYKLFHRRGNRDYFQIYVLTFLLVLAAAVAAQSVLFALGFALYLLLMVWTLILFHLRREIEENYLVRPSHEPGGEKNVGAVERILNSRRVVGRGFFGATALVALAVFAGSAVTFAFVPRIGAGFLFGGIRKGRSVAGFSDQVVLGMHGVISSDNQTVALRATVPAVTAIADEASRERAIAGLYWRGTVYDKYEQGQWERSRGDHLRTLLEPRRPTSSQGRRRLDLVDEQLTTDDVRADAVEEPDVLRQDIDIVGLSHPVAFAIDRPVGYEALPTNEAAVMRLSFEPRWSGEVALKLWRKITMTGIETPASEFAGARYVAYSRDPSRSSDKRSWRTLADPPDPEVLPYLQVPASLSPRVRELARTITAGRPTPAAKVAAVTEWLQRTHGYTTDLKRDTSIADPLEDFLFKEQAGHCEYFASAATILLRLSGVPARYVNGFLGGEWNDMSKHITVRDNRAHSWTEAYLGERGWVRTDATPSGASSTKMGRLRQLFDSLELLWSRWVVDFDLSRQLDIARRVGRQIGFDPTRPRGGETKLRLPSRDKVIGFGGVLGAIYVAFRLRRLRGAIGSGDRRGSGPRAVPVVRLYRRSLERLARRGLPRRPAETPHEFAERVRMSRVEGAEALERLTDLYAAARFGRRDIDADVVTSLARQLGNLGRPERPAAR